MFGRRCAALTAAVGIAAAIIWVLTAAVAGASSRTGPHRPTVIRPRFRSVADAVKPYSIWTSSRYALVTAAGAPYASAMLIDDQTGQVKTINRAGCDFLGASALEPLDLPWLVFDCNPMEPTPAPELYSPATGQWQAVSPSPGVLSSCGGSGCVGYGPAAAGKYWLDYHEGTCDFDNNHCSISNVFQNIGTGELTRDPAGGTTTVDLNAPNLTRTVCGPLRVPTAFPSPYELGAVPGSLVFYGSFALSIGSDNLGDDEIYLERCGTRLHRLVGAHTADGAGLTEPALTTVNTHEVVWMAHSGPFLSALTLPGLRPFTIRLPKRLLGDSCSSPDDYGDCISQIALTNYRLYILTGTVPEQLWVAPNPLPSKHPRK